jgi:hypothetical protein
MSAHHRVNSPWYTNRRRGSKIVSFCGDENHFFHSCICPLASCSRPGPLECRAILAHNRIVVMASGNYSHPSTQASASEVLKVVVLELHELQTQYKEVTSRIRNLRIAVDALRELGDTTLSELDEGTSVSARRTRTTVKEVLGENPLRTRSRTPISRSNPNPHLQRACRIALMETGDAISIDEIYSRILRRKSFEFVDRSSAIQAIHAELDSMLHQGELRRVVDSRNTTWLRLAPEKAS